NPFPDSHSIVLTKSLAHKYFGSEDPMGQMVLVNLDPFLADRKQNFRVTGIIEDFPLNSSIETDFLLPFALIYENQRDEDLNAQWGSFHYRTFFLLQEGVPIQKW